jgi:hypothetical protein
VTAPQLSPGYVVAGKYSIQAPLGHGGSSATYRAVDATGRSVALRIYSPAIAQRADVMSMIEQIYTASNGLPPDAVLPVIDAGYDPQTAAPFTVTDFSPDPSLAQLVAQRPLSPQEVSTIAQNLGRTLDAAHVRQLMHHALKPTNVFVSQQSLAVRVMDFGAGLSRTYVQTNEGYAIAAPWVAPEQMQSPTPAGPAADVFAMGLLLFHALTGRSYWRSCQGPQPDLNAWQQELFGPRTPASQRAAELGVSIPPGLDAVFNRALAINPDERPRQASELAAVFASSIAPSGSYGASAGGYGAAPGGYGAAPGGYGAAPGGYGAAPGGYGAAPGGYGAAPGGYGAPPEPATAATVAFPAYTGLPDPMGPTAASPAYAPGGGKDQGYPPPPAPPGQMGMDPGAGMPPGQGGPSQQVMSAATAEQGPGPMAPTTAAPRPGFDPNAGGGGGNKTMPILIGVGAVLLIGGAIGAWIVLGKKKPAEDPNAPIAITPQSASAGSSAAPPPTSEATPPPTSEPTSQPAAAEGDVVITCVPASCDEVKIDDKKVEIPAKVAPGMHKVVVSKDGYVAQNADITVEAGKKLEKEFKLVEEKKADATPPPTTNKSGGGGTVKAGGGGSTTKTPKCTGSGFLKKCK